MTKNLSNAAPGAELEEAETKFKNYIAEYRERAVKHAAQVNKEVRCSFYLLSNISSLNLPRRVISLLRIFLAYYVL